MLPLQQQLPEPGQCEPVGLFARCVRSPPPPHYVVRTPSITRVHGRVSLHFQQVNLIEACLGNPHSPWFINSKMYSQLLSSFDHVSCHAASYQRRTSAMLMHATLGCLVVHSQHSSFRNQKARSTIFSIILLLDSYRLINFSSSIRHDQIFSRLFLLENKYLLGVYYFHLGCQASICRESEISNLMVLHSTTSFHSYPKKGGVRSLYCQAKTVLDAGPGGLTFHCQHSTPRVSTQASVTLPLVELGAEYDCPREPLICLESISFPS
ncbi:MAG: hypothetical protein EZS28_025073 [Streblomastix strix]|uniref:Uncharacterized protein n=1 Tax=Streblomastix strix TaxID=222440 RepID=A0A5J4VAA6_9EUKA|nr:MAG: hypothetical protein EZS28_025073 [Streblomastix strix]